MITLDTHDIKFHQFRTGERGCRLIPKHGAHLKDFHTITWKFENQGEIFDLKMVVDVLRSQYGDCSIALYVPYLPYSRQDRQTQFMGDFSLRCLKDILDSMKFFKIETLDKHSEYLSFRFVDNKFPEVDLIEGRSDKTNFIGVAPDESAVRRVRKVFLSQEYIPYLEKVREGGEVFSILSKKSIEFLKNWFVKTQHSTLVLVDDICDGGRTFLAAKEELEDLYSSNNLRFWLHTTHGFYTNGIENLLKEFDTVSCINNMSEFDGRIEGNTTFFGELPNV